MCVYNEALFLILCFAVQCGSCGILPLLFTLFQNNLSSYFVWNWISSDEIPAMAWLCIIALVVCGEWELKLAVFVCCCNGTAAFSTFPSRVKASARCPLSSTGHAASMGYVPAKGLWQPGTRMNRCLKSILMYAELHYYKALIFLTCNLRAESLIWKTATAL